MPMLTNMIPHSGRKGSGSGSNSFQMGQLYFWCACLSRVLLMKQSISQLRL